MKSMNVVVTDTGDPATIITRSGIVGAVEFIDLVMRVDIAVTITVEVVGSITGIFDEGVLVKREHIVGFETPDFHLPIILAAKEKHCIIEIHFAGHVGQRLSGKTGEIAIIHFSYAVKT